MTMRIDRIEASKHKRGRVLLFLEDGACLKITEQELLDKICNVDYEKESANTQKFRDEFICYGGSATKVCVEKVFG